MIKIPSGIIVHSSISHGKSSNDSRGNHGKIPAQIMEASSHGWLPEGKKNHVVHWKKKLKRCPEVKKICAVTSSYIYIYVNCLCICIWTIIYIYTYEMCIYIYTYEIWLCLKIECKLRSIPRFQATHGSPMDPHPLPTTSSKSLAMASSHSGQIWQKSAGIGVFLLLFSMENILIMLYL